MRASRNHTVLVGRTELRCSTVLEHLNESSTNMVRALHDARQASFEPGAPRRASESIRDAENDLLQREDD